MGTKTSMDWCTKFLHARDRDMNLESAAISLPVLTPAELASVRSTISTCCASLSACPNNLSFDCLGSCVIEVGPPIDEPIRVLTYDDRPDHPCISS